MVNNRGVRLAVPLAVAAALAWLMVGCVYLPWFEQAKLSGTKRDFRDTALASAGPAIVDGHVTQDGIRQFLGEPAVASANGRVWAYTMTTAHGVWVEPLCLNVTPGGQHAYALGLRFDDRGVLEHHCLAVRDIEPIIGVAHAFDIGPPFLAEREPRGAVSEALEMIDKDNDVESDLPQRTDPAPGEVRLSRAFAVIPHH